MRPFANQYALLGRLATGGMAELFVARPTGGPDREVVVLKRIKPVRLGDPKFVSMFLDEARLASQLEHENIARVHDIGRLGESYFFTMEYIHGEDVRSLLVRLGALQRYLPIAHALHIARAVAAGLHHAHERRDADGTPLEIVHRDVSPSNVMVSFASDVKLVDFGIAKATLREATTEVGAVKGKVTYFSPEQCRGKPVDRRSDVFSLGILMHEMLTGRRLFKRQTDYHTMRAILGEPVVPPSRLRPEVTPAIDRIVLCALSKDPELRFATAGEMAAAIAQAEADAPATQAAPGLGDLLRELFGVRPEPWVELDARDESSTVVAVISGLAEPSAVLAAGTVHGAENAAIEAELSGLIALGREPTEGVVDTEVSAETGPAGAAGPDDEWADEVVVRGGPRASVPVLDPAQVIAEVRSAVANRSEFDPGDDAVTVALVRDPTPVPIATGQLGIGDRRVALVVASVRRRHVAQVITLVALAAIGLALATVALLR